MTTESEVTLPDALAWLKSLSGDYAAKIDEYINTLQIIPDGYKLVPVEPTCDMIKAWYESEFDNEPDINLINGWYSMLAASPELNKAGAQ